MPFTCAKSRTLRNNAFAIRGVPRLRPALAQRLRQPHEAPRQEAEHGQRRGRMTGDRPGRVGGELDRALAVHVRVRPGVVASAGSVVDRRDGAVGVSFSF